MAIYNQLMEVYHARLDHFKQWHAQEQMKNLQRLRQECCVWIQLQQLEERCSSRMEHIGFTTPSSDYNGHKIDNNTGSTLLGLLEDQYRP